MTCGLERRRIHGAILSRRAYDWKLLTRSVRLL
jgi:hypothetical protein